MEKRERKYSIGELAALTGVTRRTIRFYVQKGLLQKPLGRGRGNHYTEDHLERILKIRELQKDGVQLDRMRQSMEGEPSPTIQELERRLVTRVRIAEGVWLEFSEGAKVPPPGKLTQLAEYCRKILALPHSEK
jgi:DNA-binding transcriptional MerR regulator